MKLRRLVPPLILCTVIAVVLSSCGGDNAPPPEPAKPALGLYKVGEPYKIGATWFYPADDLTYNETGIASVYGPDAVHQKLTANGETFDQTVPSAAHRTLAMPTVVQVTNLDNGRSIQLRVNDRGPMAGDRILQVSRRAAELLGFGDNETAKVRVQVVKLETMQAQSLAKHTGGEDITDGAPKAVPHATVAAETLAPLGSDAPPQPIPPAPQPPPRVVEQPAPQQAAKPVVNVVPVRGNHIFIQAGAFASNANAMRMKDKLDSLGTVVVASIRVNGIDLYRVRLGPIPSVDEADRLLARAQSAGASDAKIVVD
jgi:rare lipoprotein A